MSDDARYPDGMRTRSTEGQQSNERSSKITDREGTGIFLALVCAFLGCIKGLVVSKVQTYGSLQIFGLRCLGSSLFVFPFITYKNYQVWYNWKTNMRLLFRSIVGNIAVGGLYFGFSNLSLGDASVIFYSTSVYTYLFGCLLLKEKCCCREGLSVILSLIGVALVTSPTLIFARNDPSSSSSTDQNLNESFLNSSREISTIGGIAAIRLYSRNSSDNEESEAVLHFINMNTVPNDTVSRNYVRQFNSEHVISHRTILKSTYCRPKSVVVGIVGAFVGAISQALALILLRKLQGIPAAVNSFWWSVSGTIVCLLISSFVTNFRVPTNRMEGIYMILVAAVGLSSELCLVVSLVSVEAGKISIILSSEIIWAFVLQILFQNENPTVFSIVGAVFIIIAIVLPSVKWKFGNSVHAFETNEMYEVERKLETSRCAWNIQRLKIVGNRNDKDLMYVQSATEHLSIKS